MVFAAIQSLTEVSSPSVFLEAIDIHKSFAGVQALRGVSVTLAAGEIYHLVGENGSGKSTLIKVLCGAQPFDKGELIIGGRRYRRLSPLEALSAGIETVYQDLSLIPNLSVAENIGLTEQLVAEAGRLARRLDRVRLRQTACRALLAVGLPQDRFFLDTPVDQLPIALRQLIAIARAIATQARLVIMDEPTTALTRREVERLIDVVKGLQHQGVSVLFVSHKLDECQAIGGQVIVLRDGEKVAEGPIVDYTRGELSTLISGSPIEGSRALVSVPRREIVLQTHGLGRGVAFNDVSFSLARGEILGITGLLDSGRNELARALAGVTPATRGVLRVGGIDVKLTSPRDAIEQGIGYVPEDRLNEGLFLDQSIRLNIVAVVLDRLRSRLGWLKARPGTTLASRMAADLDLSTADPECPVQSLSGGNQQRVLLGRWLMIEPRVLILHGPTVGVDVGSKAALYRLIHRLTQDGLAIILFSDDLSELLQNSDRILLMKKGFVSSEFTSSGLSEADLYRALVAESPPAASI